VIAGRCVLVNPTRKEYQALLRNSIAAILILFLMTAVAAAQESSAPFRPGVHLKDDKPSRSKEQRDYDKALDSSYRSSLKDIPDQKKTDPWDNIRSGPPAAVKNKQ
jgi:hypothetical protein